VFDTLYKKAMVLHSTLEERRKSAGLKDCTFSPAINPDSSRTPRGAKSESKDAEGRPKTARARLYDPEWVRRRHAPESNNPENRDLEECTFKPQLIAKPAAGTVRATEEEGKGRAVFEKLFEDAQKFEAKKKERLTQKEVQEVVECTFAPDLGLTRDVLENHNMGTGSAHDRLYRQALEMKQKRNVRADPSDMGCTFSPQISEASKQLSKAMRRSGGADRFQEMYAEGLLRQKHRLAADNNKSAEELTKADLEECTFRPNITPWPGMEGVSQMPVHERLYANAFNRGVNTVSDAELGPMLGEEGVPTPAMDASRRYVQGGELYLI